MNNESNEEDWAVYFSTVGENQIGSILVDLGFNNISPIESKSNLITITTFMNNPTEDGLSSAEESSILNEIEDYFIDLIVSKYNAVYPGRLKYDSKILSYFYSEKTDEFEKTFTEIESQYPNYRFEYNVKEEKDWRAYFEVLYPSPFEMQVIGNGKVIANLEKHNDNLEKERQVDHWIYFKFETEREKFLNAIEGMNFNIEDKSKISIGELPFALQLSRTDKVDYESVNEYVMYLWEKAQEFNGDYDGWETFIVRD
jgi:uncharacterized protein (TIGR01619 family)